MTSIDFEACWALAAASFGCGFQEESIPIGYASKLAQRTFSTSKWYSIEGGFQRLWESVATELKDAEIKIHLESKISAISRSNSVEIKFIDSKSKTKAKKYDRLVLACPLESLSNIMEFSDLEKDVSSQIKSSKVQTTTLLLDNKDIEPGFYRFQGNLVESETQGQVFAAHILPVSDKKVAVAYQYLQTPSNNSKLLSKETLRSACLEQVSKIFGKAEIQREFTWDSCFPHLSPNYIEKLEQNQGNLNTYYCNALLNADTVEHCVQYANMLAMRFFGVPPCKVLVSSGFLVESVEVRIVDPHTFEEKAEGEVGEIWVNSESKSPGYWNKDEINQATFHAQIIKDDGTKFGDYLRTGDLGLLYQKELYVTGRFKDMIIIKGHNYYPQDIEITIDNLQDPRLVYSSVIAFGVDKDQLKEKTELEGEGLVVVAELQVGAQNLPQLIEVIRSKIVEDHGIICYDVVLAKNRSVPKTTSGKVQRRKCLQMYLENELPMEESMISILKTSKDTENDVKIETGEGVRIFLEESLLSIFGSEFKSKLSDNFSFFEAGMTSIMSVNFASRIQSKYRTIFVSPVDIYSNSTLFKLWTHLCKKLGIPIPKPQEKVPEESVIVDTSSPIFISGIGLELPGGISGVQQYWTSLIIGETMLTAASPSRFSSKSIFGGFLTDQQLSVDVSKYKFSRIELSSMDPQQLLLLKCVEKAIDDAGLNPGSLRSLEVGVFVAGTPITTLEVGIESRTATGTAASMLANIISHVFDFQGPSEVIDTACSSSLVALQRAITSIALGQSQMAIVAGVNLLYESDAYQVLKASGLVANYDMCIPLASQSEAYVRGEGCCAIVLEKSPNCRKLAKVIGVGVNHIGATAKPPAPSVQSQIKTIEGTLRRCSRKPEEVAFVESHATGTPIGDALEIEALTTALNVSSDNTKRKLAIGTVKGMIGHLEGASGLASLIKAVLEIRHGKITPNCKLETISDYISKKNLNIEIPLLNSVYSLNVGDSPILAGINSFGFGGTNAFALIESVKQESPIVSPKTPVILMFGGMDTFPRDKVGLVLYSTIPTFRKHWDECSEITLKLLKFSMKEILDADWNIVSKEKMLPSIFVVCFQYCMAKVWLEMPDIEVAGVLGVSNGEMAASLIAGGTDIETALRATVDLLKFLNTLRYPRPAASYTVYGKIENIAAWVKGKEAEISIVMIAGTSMALVVGYDDVVEAMVGELKLTATKSRLPGSSVLHSPLVANQQEPMFNSISDRHRTMPPLRVPLYSPSRPSNWKLLTIGYSDMPTVIINPVKLAEALQCAIQDCPVIVDVSSSRSTFVLLNRILNESQLSAFSPHLQFCFSSSSKLSELQALETGHNQVISFRERQNQNSPNLSYNILSYITEFSLNGRMQHVIHTPIQKLSTNTPSYLLIEDKSKFSSKLKMEAKLKWDDLTDISLDAELPKKENVVLVCLEVKELLSKFQDLIFPKLKSKKNVIFIMDSTNSLKLSISVARVAKVVENMGSESYLIDISGANIKHFASNFNEMISPLFSTKFGHNRVFGVDKEGLMHRKLGNLDLVSDLNLFAPSELSKTLITVIAQADVTAVLRALDVVNPGCILVVNENGSQLTSIGKTRLYKQCLLTKKHEVKGLYSFTKTIMEEQNLVRQIVVTATKSEEEYTSLQASKLDKIFCHISKCFAKCRMIILHGFKENALPSMKLFSLVKNVTTVEYNISQTFDTQISAIMLSLINYQGSYIRIGPKISKFSDKSEKQTAVALRDLSDIVSKEVELVLGYKVDPNQDLFSQGLTSIGAQQLASRLLATFPDLKYSPVSIMVNNSVARLVDYIKSNSSFVSTATETSPATESAPRAVMLQEDPFSQIPFSIPHPKPAKAAISSDFLLGIFQLLGVFFILMLQKFCALPGFYVSQIILGDTWRNFWNSNYDVLTSIVVQVEVWRFLLVVLAMLLGYSISMIALSILLKWVLIGKYQPGVHPLWSFYFFRWWLVDKIVKLTESLIIRHFQGTGLVNLWYKLLGTKISWTSDVVVGNLRCFDLITIGEYSSLEGTLKTSAIIDATLRLDVVTIGKCVTMEKYTVVTPGSTIKDFTYITAFCVTTPGTTYDEGRTLHLNPATYKNSEVTSPWEPHSFFKISYGRAILQTLGLGMLIVPLLVGSIAAYYSLKHLSDWWIASSTYGRLVRFLFSLTLLFFHMGLCSVVWALLLKWILIGKLKPHERRLSNWFWSRLWLVERIVSLCDLFIGIFEGTLVIFSFVNLLGAQISPTNMCLRLLGFTNLADWDLIKIEPECFCGISFVETRLINKKEGKIRFFAFNMKKQAKLSAFDYARPGVTLMEEALVGQMVRLEQESTIATKSMLIGNPSQVLHFHFEHSVHPFYHWLRVVLGTLGSLTGIGFMLLCTYTVLVILVQLPAWTIIISIDLLLLHVISWTFVIILQHGIVFPLIQHGKDFDLSSFRLVGWGVLNLAMGLFNLFIFPLWSGSYVYNVLLRFAGAKIGSKVYLGVDWIPDFAELNIRDNVTVENGSILEGHGFKGGAFYFNYLTLEQNTSILGPGTIGALHLPKGLHSWPLTSYLPEHSSITPVNSILAGQPGKVIGTHDSQV